MILLQHLGAEMGPIKYSPLYLMQVLHYYIIVDDMITEC